MTIQDDVLTAGLSVTLATAGRAIVYHRGASQVSLTAIKGRELAQAVDGDTIVSETEHVDWVFKLADLAALTAPAKGDWIAWSSKRYDLTEEQGQGWHRTLTPDETWVRVHTTYTGAA
jgi:hypothetical protein